MEPLDTQVDAQSIDIQTVKEIPVSSVVLQPEKLNEHNELVLKGDHNGTNVEQTLPINPPCALFFDRSNNNFYTVPIQVEPTWEFVKFIAK